MEFTEEEKPKTDIASIKKDFLSGLENAENKDPDSQINSSRVIPDKLKLVLPDTAARLVCDIKNSIKAKIITKDMDEATKEFVRDFLKTTPKEVELYKKVLEQVGTDYTPESYKEFLNKWLGSPIVLIIEYELESMLTLRSLLAEMDKNKPKPELKRAA